MPALTANLTATDSDLAPRPAWARPERGFDDGAVRGELEAAERVLDALQRELARDSEPELPGAGTGSEVGQEATVQRANHPCRSLVACVCSCLCPVGAAALLVGAGLLVGSFFGDRGGLWDAGLTVVVIGQTALLLASLAPGR